MAVTNMRRSPSTPLTMSEILEFADAEYVDKHMAQFKEELDQRQLEPEWHKAALAIVRQWLEKGCMPAMAWEGLERFLSRRRPKFGERRFRSPELSQVIVDAVKDAFEDGVDAGIALRWRYWPDVDMKEAKRLMNVTSKRQVEYAAEKAEKKLRSIAEQLEDGQDVTNLASL